MLDPFRHHVWATLHLVERCRELDPAHLAGMTAPGTYGTVVDTLRHVLGSEAGYRFRLTGSWPAWTWSPDGSATLDDLQASAEESARFWPDYLASGPRVDHRLPLIGPDARPYTLPVGLLLAQVLHHGTDHRSQVCTVLTTAGVEPPRIDCWAFGKASGRIAPTQPGR